jgi:hypothetical protein
VVGHGIPGKQGWNFGLVTHIIHAPSLPDNPPFAMPAALIFPAMDMPRC